MAEGGLSSGCCKDPNDGRGRPGAVFILASIASNTVSEFDSSSGMDAFGNECVVLTDRLGEGSGGHEDSSFSGDQGPSSVGEESGIGIGSSNDSSASLLHADDAPGSIEVTAIASASAV
jgi:hypothetical protein